MGYSANKDEKVRGSSNGKVVAMIKEGSVCIVTRGRLAGKKVVVKKVLDDIYVLAETEDGKEKKLNKRHLIPTG